MLNGRRDFVFGTGSQARLEHKRVGITSVGGLPRAENGAEEATVGEVGAAGVVRLLPDLQFQVVDYLSSNRQLP